MENKSTVNFLEAIKISEPELVEVSSIKGHEWLEPFDTREYVHYNYFKDCKFFLYEEPILKRENMQALSHYRDVLAKRYNGETHMLVRFVDDLGANELPFLCHKAYHSTSNNYPLRSCLIKMLENFFHQYPEYCEQKKITGGINDKIAVILGISGSTVDKIKLISKYDDLLYRINKINPNGSDVTDALTLRDAYEKAKQLNDENKKAKKKKKPVAEPSLVLYTKEEVKFEISILGETIKSPEPELIGKNYNFKFETKSGVELHVQVNAVKRQREESEGSISSNVVIVDDKRQMQNANEFLAEQH